MSSTDRRICGNLFVPQFSCQAIQYGVTSWVVRLEKFWIANKYIQKETIILARLNNGDVHMLGDADRGAEIGDNVEASSGKAVTDNNGATLSFVYDTPTAQIYTGDMDSLIGQSTNLDEVEEVIP